MSREALTGVLLIVSAVWFNIWFVVLARRFDYPDILRRPTDEILERFRARGSSLILTWWAFMASGGLFVASVVLLTRILEVEAATASQLALVAGVLAGLVRGLALLRWVYLVPALAREHADPEASDATRAATAVTFPAFHQYLGIGGGGHLGSRPPGVGTIRTGIAIVSGTVVGSWIGWLAIPIGAGLALGSAEFLGPNEKEGWKLAGTAGAGL